MADASRRTFLAGASALALGTTTTLPEFEAQAAGAADHEAFVRLSSVLTGLVDGKLPAMVEQNDANGVSLKLHEIYFERVRSAYPLAFRDLLAVWRGVEGAADPGQALSQELGAKGPAGKRLRIVARQVIKIWYLSTIDDPQAPLDPKNGRNSGQIGGDLGQYENSAIWKLLGAAVPGYSNFSHGYWVDKPPGQTGGTVPDRIAPDSFDSNISTAVELPDG